MLSAAIPFLLPAVNLSILCLDGIRGGNRILCKASSAGHGHGMALCHRGRSHHDAAYSPSVCSPSHCGTRHSDGEHRVGLPGLPAHTGQLLLPATVTKPAGKSGTVLPVCDPNSLKPANDLVGLSARFCRAEFYCFSLWESFFKPHCRDFGNAKPSIYPLGKARIVLLPKLAYTGFGSSDSFRV